MSILFMNYSQMNGYNIEEALYDISDAMWEATDKQCHIMADLFSAIYGEKYDWKYKHSDSYWDKQGGWKKKHLHISLVLLSCQMQKSWIQLKMYFRKHTIGLMN